MWRLGLVSENNKINGGNRLRAFKWSETNRHLTNKHSKSVMYSFKNGLQLFPLPFLFLCSKIIWTISRALKKGSFISLTTTDCSLMLFMKQPDCPKNKKEYFLFSLRPFLSGGHIFSCKSKALLLWIQIERYIYWSVRPDK